MSFLGWTIVFYKSVLMSSTNNANVIERVLNNKTIFNYLLVTNNINVL